ncbi:GNAT family N-acetyltransferase [Psychrosphaera sp. B3R10]|uniref:GNAT family N-acetyltransferase n=1 Tax=unclassified Psychrosphaera TaxID=2641570 RepID=UPI001C087D28|nr:MULTISPECIES: GNAT family N-acetyltransferase [unclassified Psychrosphaera]MBU2881235.1 GNAT family N-acetyltransferase [Psychrosphaera sp. I2R16]MBU2988334.1 GNAT family N-acetyltransferase [Psychrosphaera sp. B3R10]
MSYKVNNVNWRRETDYIEEIKEVRNKVFICEHRIPETEEFDNNDINCEHVLVRNEDDKAVATGRICENGKISRIAVLMKYRNTNAAQKVIQQLLSIAHRKGINQVTIDAELDNVSYFTNQGFKPVGAVYMESGIPKQTLSCSVNSFVCPHGILH